MMAAPFPGFDMAYGDNLWYWKHARVGWEIGFGLLPITIKDSSLMAATVNQTAYVYVGRQLWPSPPRLIRADPSGRSHIPSTYSSRTARPPAGTVTGTRQLDVMLYTVRLGPVVLLGFDG